MRTNTHDPNVILIRVGFCSTSVILVNLYSTNVILVSFYSTNVILVSFYSISVITVERHSHSDKQLFNKQPSCYCNDKASLFSEHDP